MDLHHRADPLTACYVALNPPAADPDPNLALTPRPAKHRFEWLVPAGAVLVLFVVFLAAQASALFGGGSTCCARPA